MTQPLARDNIKAFILNGMTGSRDELKDAIRASLEGHDTEDDLVQAEVDEHLPATEPHALNSDGLLHSLGSKLGFDTMTTFSSRERGLDNPL